MIGAIRRLAAYFIGWRGYALCLLTGILLVALGNANVLADQKSYKFRARLDLAGEASVGVGAVFVNVQIAQYNFGMWSPPQKLRLKFWLLPLAPGVGIAIKPSTPASVSGPGEWTEFVTDGPASIDDFSGIWGGVTFFPSVSVGSFTRGGAVMLTFQLPPRNNTYVWVSGGSGLGITIASQYFGTWRNTSPAAPKTTPKATTGGSTTAGGTPKPVTPAVLVACKQAEADFAIAKQDIAAGKLGAAEAKLKGLDASQCPTLGPKIAEELTRISELVDRLTNAQTALGACKFKNSRQLIKALPAGPRRAVLVDRWNKAYETERKARDLVVQAKALENDSKPGRAVGKLRQAKELGPCQSTIAAIDRAISIIQQAITRARVAEAKAALGACQFKKSRELISKLPEGSRGSLVNRWNKVYETEGKARDLVVQAKALENDGKPGRAVGKLHQAKDLNPCQSTIAAIDQAISRLQQGTVWKLVKTRKNPNGYKGNYNESTRDWKKIDKYSATGSGLRFTFSWTDTRRQAVRVKDIVFDFKVKNLPKKITAGKPVKFTLEGVADNKINRPYAEARIAEIRVRRGDDPNADFRRGLKLGPGSARKGRTTESIPIEFTVPLSTPRQFEIHFHIGKTAAYVVWVYSSQAAN